MTHNLDVGQVLSRVFEIYKDQAAVLLPVAAAVFLVQAVIAAVLVSASSVLVILAILVGVVFSTLYAGMVVELVSDVQDGRRDHSVGQLFGAVTGVVLPLILAGLVVGILVAIGLVLLIVPGLFALTIFAVVAPSIVVERKGVGEALGRSRELVRGNAMSVFGVIVVVFLLTVVVSAVVGAIGGGAGTGGRVVAEFIARTLTAPLGALAAAVLYFELRRAKGEAAPTEPAPATGGLPTA
jgi:ABC-type multidrug transport system fused ATPase/permease subunit